jgi:hypothetical protein
MLSALNPRRIGPSSRRKDSLSSQYHRLLPEQAFHINAISLIGVTSRGY